MLVCWVQPRLKGGKKTREVYLSRDGVVVRASASQSVDLRFISQVESYQKTKKMVFTASLLGAQHIWDSVENKPASLLVVPSARHLTGCLRIYVADRWWGQAVYPPWPSVTKDMQTEHELICVNE